MSDVATLITAIGGLLTVLFSGVTAILALRTGSKRERRDAGRKAIERVMDTDDEDADDDRLREIKKLAHELQRQQLLRELAELDGEETP